MSTEQARGLIMSPLGSSGKMPGVRNQTTSNIKSSIKEFIGGQAGSFILKALCFISGGEVAGLLGAGPRHGP